MCGADADRQPPGEQGLGSSPRVRSRPLLAHVRPPPVGIISACAEQTPATSPEMKNPWDHLRVCGADAGILPATTAVLGSSPRVRSRRDASYRDVVRFGIISACAEQTQRIALGKWNRRDHLRVCGADLRPCATRQPNTGSSPRVRSRLEGNRAGNRAAGIISACAEQTATQPHYRAAARDHLRVCGADQ